MRILNFKFQISNFASQRGQVILILLLTMLVALSIGLVVTQRSITDVATSTQTDQANRAFSAAEAGIEEVIQRGTYGSQNITNLGNASAQVEAYKLPAGNEALEYPPIGKDVVAQVWFANLDKNGTDGAPEAYYNGPAIEVYFGNKGMIDKGLKDVDTFSDSSNTSQNYVEYKPAVSLTFVNKTSPAVGPAAYSSYKVYLDSYNSRKNSNNFQIATCRSSGYKISTTSGESTFYCMMRFDIKKDESGGAPTCNSASQCVPILVRIRVLYATEPQKIAINPVISACTNTPCLPPQASRYVSTGQAGRSQKTIEVFRVKKVVPPWFDFSIFSAGEITK